jgi:hypothetical protein
MLKIYAMCCGRLEFDRSFFFSDEAPGSSHAIEVPAFLIARPHKRDRAELQRI